jgi:hypothetical protein
MHVSVLRKSTYSLRHNFWCSGRKLNHTGPVILQNTSTPLQFRNILFLLCDMLSWRLNKALNFCILNIYIYFQSIFFTCISLWVHCCRLENFIRPIRSFTAACYCEQTSKSRKCKHFSMLELDQLQAAVLFYPTK